MVSDMLAARVASNITATPIRLATCLFGGASAAAGVLDAVWGEFEPAHQPIQALGDHVPGQVLLAFLAAALLIAGGAAVVSRRTARTGAIALGAVYLAFALFWLPRFYTATRVLGLRFPVIVGLMGGIFMQLILVAAAAILYKPLQGVTNISRWTFGVAAISFGLVHLTNVPATARMIPGWMPLTPNFWTVLSGVAFALAGLAMLAQVLDLLAARLLTLMLLLFDVLVLVRLPLAHPHDHVAWGANAYNLAAAGAVWIYAESVISVNKKLS
jgi:hypothetical protein